MFSFAVDGVSLLSVLRLPVTHTVVAAPARTGFGCVAHLLQGLGSEVAQFPQAAVVEYTGADPAGVKVIGRPHFAHVTHLVARRLRKNEGANRGSKTSSWVA